MDNHIAMTVEESAGLVKFMKENKDDAKDEPFRGIDK